MVNCSVVLLLGGVSLMAGSTTGVPMSPWYGGYQAAVTSSYTEVSKYYTTKATEFHTTTYTARATRPTPRSLFYPDLLNHQGTGVCSLRMLPHPTRSRLPSTTLFAPTAPRLQLITPSKWSNTTPKRRSPTLPQSQPITTEAAKYYTVPIYYTVAAPSYYVEQKYYADASVYYTEEPKYYFAPSYYQTKAHKYHTSKSLEYYTTTYASPADFKEILEPNLNCLCSDLSVISHQDLIVDV